MPVLSRKSKEAVIVGGDNGVDRLVKVTVLEIKQGQVKLGFEVFANVPANRLEVCERLETNRPPGSVANSVHLEWKESSAGLFLAGVAARRALEMRYLKGVFVMSRKVLFLSLLVGSLALIFAISDVEARHCRKNHSRHHSGCSQSSYGNCGSTHSSYGQCGSGHCGNQQAGQTCCQASTACSANGSCSPLPGTAATAVIPTSSTAPAPAAVETVTSTPGA